MGLEPPKRGSLKWCNVSFLENIVDSSLHWVNKNPNPLLDTKCQELELFIAQEDLNTDQRIEFTKAYNITVIDSKLLAKGMVICLNLIVSHIYSSIDIKIWIEKNEGFRCWLVPVDKPVLKQHVKFAMLF